MITSPNTNRHCRQTFLGTSHATVKCSVGDFQAGVTSYSLVIRWAYKHQIWAGEVKNSGKVSCSVSIEPMFLVDLRVLDNDVLEAR